MKILKIISGNYEWEAELYKTPTAELIWDSLPLEGPANVWGEEIYFTIPVDTPQEGSAREIVDLGDLGFWPVGNAFCIFFGPTPVSSGMEPRACSPVNVFGRITTDLTDLKKVTQGEIVKVEKTG